MSRLLLLALTLHTLPAAASEATQICAEIRNDDGRSLEWECMAFVEKDQTACRRISAEDHPVSRAFCEALYRRVLDPDPASCASLEHLGASRARSAGIPIDAIEGRLAPRYGHCKALMSRDAGHCTRTSSMLERQACAITVRALIVADRQPDGADAEEASMDDTDGDTDMMDAFAEVPAMQRDPITGEQLARPVIAPDGRTYERDALLDYLSAHGGRLPDGTPCRSEDLRRDQSMRDRVAGDPDSWTGLLEDPITMVEMTEPVVASDGRTYDLSTLKQLVRTGGKSPFDRSQLEPVAYRNLTLEQQLADERGDGVIPASRSNPLVRIDGLDKGGDYSGRDLSGSAMAGADLSGSRFTRAVFVGNDLSQARLRGADFRSARLGARWLAHGDALPLADDDPRMVRVANQDEPTEHRVGDDGRILGPVPPLGRLRYAFSAVAAVRTDLRGADMQLANLEGADLYLALARGADFRGADLRTASLRYADLSDATLHRANLSRAVLKGATFRRARMSGLGMSLEDARALIPSMTDDPTFRVTRDDEGRVNGAVIGVNLQYADFSGADLEDADLSWATMKGTNFQGANLSGASLAHGHLEYARMRGADLTGVNFAGADLRSADLRDTVRTGAVFVGADLTGAILPTDW